MSRPVNLVLIKSKPYIKAFIICCSVWARRESKHLVQHFSVCRSNDDLLSCTFIRLTIFGQALPSFWIWWHVWIELNENRYYLLPVCSWSTVCGGRSWRDRRCILKAIRIYKTRFLIGRFAFEMGEHCSIFAYLLLLSKLVCSLALYSLALSQSGLELFVFAARRRDFPAALLRSFCSRGGWFINRGSSAGWSSTGSS